MLRTPQNLRETPFQTPSAILGPPAAILDFAGGAALQAVSEIGISLYDLKWSCLVMYGLVWPYAAMHDFCACLTIALLLKPSDDSNMGLSLYFETQKIVVLGSTLKLRLF